MGAALATLSCQQRSDQQQQGGVEPKIVRGTLVDRGRLLGVVGLAYDNAREPLCTGTLVAPDAVLTAAHCVCRKSPTHIFVGENPSERGSGATGRYYTAGKWKTKLTCGVDTSARGIDLAVVHINGRVGVTPPLELAGSTETLAATQLPIAGYGATDTNGTAFDYRKRWAEVPVVSRDCQGSGEAARYGCEAGEIVAGQLATPDTCLGDSGGPLLVRAVGAGSDGIRVAGVTSRGVRSPMRCGAGGIYEPVWSYRDWIGRTVIALRGG